MAREVACGCPDVGVDRVSATLQVSEHDERAQDAVSHGSCRQGGRFSRCHEAAVDTCQYCGKPFCEQHKHHIGGHEAVCNSKRCVAKHEDLAQHLEYRARVRQRNQAGLCGIEECGPHPTTECSLCRGHFCEPHVRSRMYPTREGKVIIDRPVGCCDWCWKRRKVWNH